MHTESWPEGLKPEATWKTRFTWEENVKEIRVGGYEVDSYRSV
jgi:hypothetical protein